MKAELKIFIAGSKALKQQRTLIRDVASNLATDYERKSRNVKLSVYSFENFGLTFDKNGQQNNYNEFIRNQADLVIFVFENKAGGITLDEFNIAYGTYSRKKRPQICMFSKKSPVRNADLDSLRGRVNALNQYYNEYEDDMELERLVEKLLRDNMDARLYKATRWSFFKSLALTVAVSLAVVLALNLPKSSESGIEIQPQTQVQVPAPAPVQTVPPQPKPAVQSAPQQAQPEHAKPSLKSLADEGDPSSCYQLAKNYQNGVNGVAKDLSAAFAYMKKAAEAGYTKAFRPLAEMYHGGRGVDKDRDTAAHWYQMAADNGDRSALQVLNNM